MIIMYGREVANCKHCLYIFLTHGISVIFIGVNVHAGRNTYRGSDKFIRGTGVVEVTRKNRFVDGISCLVFTLGRILCCGVPDGFVAKPLTRPCLLVMVIKIK
jgi:hypothetical protein